MIFKPEMVEKILAGEKTVTRRPAKTQMGHLATTDTRPEARAACRYEVGKDYAVQPGRGKKAAARIRVVRVHREPLGPVSKTLYASEVHREGFSTWWDFSEYWEGLYGAWVPDQLVDRIEFELVRQEAAA